jgi:polysaccharide deacetylase family protein (PEP-CTERM system associated)
MLNALTIDVEDYFQVLAFSDVIRYEEWENFECRVERNTNRLLDILDECKSNFLSNFPNSLPQTSVLGPRTSQLATFFVLGWIAERYPNLIRRIKDQGHEIACHGYAHKVIYNQTKEEFREDIRKSKAILEDITGSEVIGYRAPSYSITNKSQWAFEVLVEEGFKYDSSIFPIHHDFYGMPYAPRFPFIISLNGNSNFEFSMLNFELNAAAPQHGSTTAQQHVFSSNASHLPPNTLHLAPCVTKTLIEFPLSTTRLLGQNLPISGGGYFRLFPYSIIRKGLKSINEKENKPFIFYVHPWELDIEQPHIKNASMRSRFRHYVNLNKTENKFRTLLKDFNFLPVKEILELNSSLT